ncbi:MAG: sigma-70 family RNA polymerase sigma factor [Prevotella sp.]|nr:sigma-70 family RNA polymerase sigma factor [Prevotella sp.]
MDERAFEQIAPRMRQKVMETLCRYQLDRMECEDIAQEVLLRLWQMRNELAQVRSIDALVTVMARRLAITSMRHSAMPSIEENVRIDTGDDNTPIVQLETKENEEWLEEKLKRLPDTQRAVLQMRQIEHRSVEEIARLLCIDNRSVSTLLARARRSLLEEIKKRRI